MSSKIEWTNETWNPVIGCTKVSPGCANCYAERFANRLAGIEKTKEYGEVITNGKWNGKIIVQSHQFTRPLSWKKPRMIFVCSMSDLFHTSVPFEIIDDVFSIMQKTPQHTYQISTKRPEGMKAYFESRNLVTGENIWLGVSIEYQEYADHRIPYLLQTPATVRFVSCEPLLGSVSLDVLHYRDMVNINSLTGKFGVTYPLKGNLYSGLDWVIVGGESGPNARPMHPDWVRSIRDQCQGSGTPFFFKQWGDWVPRKQTLAKGFKGWHNLRYFQGIPYWKVGKKSAGRLLDGKEYNEYPKIKQPCH
jgi:protein gp37